MAEPDPPSSQLVGMLATGAWWVGLDEAQRRRVTAAVEERRFAGGTVVMREGETIEVDRCYRRVGQDELDVGGG